MALTPSLPKGTKQDRLCHPSNTCSSGNPDRTHLQPVLPSPQPLALSYHNRHARRGSPLAPPLLLSHHSTLPLHSAVGPTPTYTSQGLRIKSSCHTTRFLCYIPATWLLKEKLISSTWVSTLPVFSTQNVPLQASPPSYLSSCSSSEKCSHASHR